MMAGNRKKSKNYDFFHNCSIFYTNVITTNTVLYRVKFSVNLNLQLRSHSKKYPFKRPNSRTEMDFKAEGLLQHNNHFLP